jgi:hypothetical protein
MNNTDYEKTADMGLAASLVASGFNVVDVERSDPRRVVFVFINNPELQEHISRFWSDDLLLPAGLLLDSIRKLKARIYS